MTGMAAFILRWRLPDENRPYRTWGYPYVPMIFIGAYGWISLRICADQPLTSLVGFLIAVSGIPFYLFWSRRKTE
jgi:APA family basic amino acid/polyamine antiporter